MVRKGLTPPPSPVYGHFCNYYRCFCFFDAFPIRPPDYILAPQINQNVKFSEMQEYAKILCLHFFFRITLFGPFLVQRVQKYIYMYTIKIIKVHTTYIRQELGRGGGGDLRSNLGIWPLRMQDSRLSHDNRLGCMHSFCNLYALCSFYVQSVS